MRACLALAPASVWQCGCAHDRRQRVATHLWVRSPLRCVVSLACTHKQPRRVATLCLRAQAAGEHPDLSPMMRLAASAPLPSRPSSAASTAGTLPSTTSTSYAAAAAGEPGGIALCVHSCACLQV